MIKADLFIIDPQVDFCNPKGALYVKGAEDDMTRLAAMINRTRSKLHDIHVTMDTHHLLDVAHPLYWKNTAGVHPAPFTIITVKDVEQGVWIPTIPSFITRSLEYVKTLEKNGRYPLCIWPPHCLIGSEGHKVVPEVFAELTAWEEANISMVNYVTKGSNLFTEHYSGLLADVPDPSDESTQINSKLIKTLESVDMIAVAGEASSHCVANTIRDLVNNFSQAECAKKLIILEDAMSPVGTYENLAAAFFDEMKQKGVTFQKTTEFLA